MHTNNKAARLTTPDGLHTQTKTTHMKRHNKAPAAIPIRIPSAARRLAFFSTSDCAA